MTLIDKRLTRNMASPCCTIGYARPFEMEIEEGCDNLDKRVSGDCVLDIWVNAPESMI